MTTTTKKITLDLATVDGNAFFLLAAFRRQAHKEGWTIAEIKAVIDEAKSANYDHLVATLLDHCK